MEGFVELSSVPIDLASRRYKCIHFVFGVLIVVLWIIKPIGELYCSEVSSNGAHGSSLVSYFCTWRSNLLVQVGAKSASPRFRLAVIVNN